MRLADRGRVDLERPLLDYLPNFKLSDGETEKRLTMKHLLIQLSGKGDYFKDFRFGKNVMGNMVKITLTLPQINPPEMIISYCNSGFMSQAESSKRLPESPSKKPSMNWFQNLSISIRSVSLPNRSLPNGLPPAIMSRRRRYPLTTLAYKESYASGRWNRYQRREFA